VGWKFVDVPNELGANMVKASHGTQLSNAQLGWRSFVIFSLYFIFKFWRFAHADNAPKNGTNKSQTKETDNGYLRNLQTRVWRAEGIWEPFSGVTFPAYDAGYPENHMVGEIRGGVYGFWNQAAKVPKCQARQAPTPETWTSNNHRRIPGPKIMIHDPLVADAQKPSSALAKCQLY